jgi:hypothetical protein
MTHGSAYADRPRPADRARAAGRTRLRAERRAGGDRRGRFAFLAGSGVLANTIFLALILLGGIGSLVLDPCAQS